jgi:hypothetical protein
MVQLRVHCRGAPSLRTFAAHIRGECTIVEYAAVMHYKRAAVKGNSGK